ncbi:hypothetical protein ACQKND_16330 [Viridibacillus arvi]|uniref:hypothetical protein n=1 Tax=Viridibacillus arvi TaxID=263475 RepID=UPI003CFBE51F
MPRHRYKSRDFYKKIMHNHTDLHIDCDVCKKTITPNKDYYIVNNLEFAYTFSRLSHLQHEVYFKLAEHRFCSPQCIKRQVMECSDRKLEEYIKMANESIDQLNDQRYNQFIASGFYSF